MSRFFAEITKLGGFNVRLVFELVGSAFCGGDVAAFADIDWLID